MGMRNENCWSRWSPCLYCCSLELVADSDGRYGSDEVNAGRIDSDVDLLRRLEDAHESPVEDLRDAVSTDGRVGRDLAEAEAKRQRSLGRPVENGHGHAAGGHDPLHPDRDVLPLNTQ